ncbi:MAG: sigma-70 family RNA polymerase sigma factor [Alcaligenaceae bacterium]|nr:sigma-70 family RNA polymerase sigma factor [Alcaligenaceae bacterium]
MTVSDFDFEGELAACASGDQNAFQALYEHEAPSMMALACSLMGDSAAARDLLSETFILIWRNADGYSPALGTARAWMYSILRYRAQARLRQSGHPAQAVGNSIEDASDPDAISTGVMRALDRLGRVPRQAILLAYCKGLSYRQIAQRMHMPADSLRTQTLAGLDRARTLLEA